MLGTPAAAGGMYLPSGMESEVMAEWRRRSRNVLYQTDPVAWLWDVLGERWWSKQEEIAWSFVENQFTIVKSCNGVGKTKIAGDLVSWFVNVFDPMETMALVSAPVRSQIDENMFNYLRANYYSAAQRGHDLVGEITKWPKWVVNTPYPKDLVTPKRPADQNLISSFQGLHFDHMAVVLDEAGGLQEDFYIGANAVTTNKHARILAIGNPDQRNTAFHNRFKDRERFKDWNTFSIAAKDTPNFTGEEIYPEDPERDAKIKGRLVQVEWADMMRRSASPGVVAAKVDAEFPGDDDNTFFPQIVINRAWETFSFLKALVEANELPKSARRYLGVDVAFAGSDKNVICLNNGGLVTTIDTWGAEEGEETVEDMAIARRVHRHAQELGVHEVRIDAAGTSRGVHSNLKSEAEFAGRTYVLIGVNGAHASPDKRKYANARAWHYFQMKQQMSDGTLGLDPSNTELRTDLEVQTYKYNLRQQLQITPKDELKKELKRSPDHLDAAIYASIDMSGVTDGPAAGLEPGDTVVIDPWEELMAESGMYGMPI